LLHESQELQPEGIEIDFIPQPGGSGQMAAALRNDELDMAVLLTEGITANILKGDKVKLVKFYVNSPLQWGFHVSASNNFENPSDLANKRFAISRLYSGSHLMAHVHAKYNGVELQDDQFVVVKDLEGARRALQNQEADYFLWEKYTTQPLVDAGEFKRIGVVPTPWPCFVVAVRESFLEANEEAIALVLNTIQNIEQRLEDQPQQTVIGIANRFKLQEEQVQSWFKELWWNKSFELSPEVFIHVTRELLNVGIIEQRHVKAPESYLHELKPNFSLQ